MKSVSIMEGEATPRRSVPLPVDEKEEETEEAREEGEGGIVVIAGGGGVRGGHAHQVTLNFHKKY